MKLEHFLTPYTKINSKWIKDLNVRPETLRLLEENVGRTLDDINQIKILYDPLPRVTEIKTKVNTVKGFGIVNKAEIDVFLELSCFFDDPADVGNLIYASSAFSKTSLNIRKFTVHILLKPGLENFEHYLLACEMSAIVR